MEDDLVESNGEINEQSTEIKETKVATKTKTKDTKNAKSKLRSTKSGGNNETKSKKNAKQKKKSSTKKTAKKETPKNVSSKSVDKKSNDKASSQVVGVKDLVTIILPKAYLQTITNTITIQENVDLTQEMIYEQDIGTLASSATYDSLISSSSSRFNGMVDVRPKHSFGGYGR